MHLQQEVHLHVHPAFAADTAAVAAALTLTAATVTIAAVATLAAALAPAALVPALGPALLLGNHLLRRAVSKRSRLEPQLF